MADYYFRTDIVNSLVKMKNLKKVNICKFAEDGTLVKICDNKTICMSMVYYASLFGFVLSCIRLWVLPATALKYKYSGVGKIIGLATWSNKQTEDRWMIRWYKAAFKCSRSSALPACQSFWRILQFNKVQMHGGWIDGSHISWTPSYPWSCHPSFGEYTR